jgi:hypothetical protein
MVNFLAAAATRLGYQFGGAAVTKTIKYGSEAVGGAIAYNQLHQVKKGVEKQINVPYLGNYVGAAVAGCGLGATKEQADRISQAVFDLSKQVIETAVKEEIKPEAANITDQISGQADQVPATSNNQTSYFDAAVKTATKAAPLLAGVALATGVLPAVPASLTFAAINSVPKIFEALTTRVDPKKDNIELVDDVLKPVAKEMIFKTAGVAANGIARFNTVVNNYETRLNTFEQVPKGLVAWAPKCVQNVAGNIGWLAGKVEAPRYAMSDASIQAAIQNGEYAEKITLAGLDTIDLAAQLAIKQNKDNSYWDIAKNTGIFALAILGGTAFAVVTPEAAALAGGVAVLGVTDKAIKWVKLQLTPEEANQLQAAKEAGNLASIEKQAADKPMQAPLVQEASSINTDKELTMESVEHLEFHIDDHFIPISYA